MMKKWLINVWVHVPGVQWRNIEERISDVMPSRFWKDDYGFSDQLENVDWDYWVADRAEEAAQNRGRAIDLNFSRLHYSRRSLMRVAKERTVSAERGLACSQAASLEKLAQRV